MVDFCGSRLLKMSRLQFTAEASYFQCGGSSKCHAIIVSHDTLLSSYAEVNISLFVIVLFFFCALIPELQKRADRADQSVLIFSGRC